MFTQNLHNRCVCFANQALQTSPLAIPISSLDPVTLVEGQAYRQAAFCRSMAQPPPRLSWDTDLNGQSTNRSSDKGVVTSQFSLHPLRSMNGMKLDCLVWHPTSAKPRRLPNNLVVHCEYLFVANEQQLLQMRETWPKCKVCTLSSSSSPSPRGGDRLQRKVACRFGGRRGEVCEWRESSPADDMDEVNNPSWIFWDLLEGTLSALVQGHSHVLGQLNTLSSIYATRIDISVR